MTDVEFNNVCQTWHICHMLFCSFLSIYSYFIFYVSSRHENIRRMRSTRRQTSSFLTRTTTYYSQLLFCSTPLSFRRTRPPLPFSSIKRLAPNCFIEYSYQKHSTQHLRPQNFNQNSDSWAAEAHPPSRLTLDPSRRVETLFRVRKPFGVSAQILASLLLVSTICTS